MNDMLSTYTRTTAAVAGILDTGSDPVAETPCTDWNYAELLGHLVDGERMMAGIVSGTGGPPQASDSASPGEPPVSSAAGYRAATTTLAGLLAAPDVQERTFTTPVGELPAQAIVVLRSVENLLHGWDLAKSSGVSTEALEPCAAALMTPAQQLLASVGEVALAGRPFADPVPTDEKASELDRLVGAFGRDPQWRRDG